MKQILILITVVVCSVSAKISSKNETESNTVDTGKGQFFPPEFYVKAYNYMKHASAFKDYTLKEAIVWIDNAENWVPPKEITEGFPYYLAGYDDEDRPVWYGEVGKYDVKAVVSRGKQAQDDLERYVFQACLRVLQSFQNVTGKDVTQYILVTDWEGLDVSQVAYIPTVQYAIGLSRKYIEIIHLALHKMIAINVNYATELLVQIARPVMVAVFENIEIYGNNKAKWKAYLQKVLPPEVIPPWYGGPKGFKPIAIYG